jgi:phenylpropionate dioxygenase-like ring-hydroxylating dioxygenase large terminal subunit
MNEFESAPQMQTSSTGMLLGFWYPACRSTDLRRGKLTPVTLLGLSVVVGMDGQGRSFALRDACPHRAMPLSCGLFDGSTVECIYHGWQFDARTGICRSIPSLPADSTVKVERIHADSFPCAERDGILWIYLPDPESRWAGTAMPSVPELPVFSVGYRSFFHTVEFPSDIDQGVLGLIDPAHGPYVHQSWFWRSRHALREKQKVFEPIPNGFRMSPHPPSPNSAAYRLLGALGESFTTTIDFELPGIRTEMIRSASGKYWFTDRTIMTPLSETRCRLDFCAAWNIFRGVPFVASIFGAFARRFIAQDQGNFERQAPGLRSHPRMMLVGDADRQARWYFDLKAAWRESLRTGAPPVHPLAGPVTLRWRT